MKYWPDASGETLWNPPSAALPRSLPEVVTDVVFSFIASAAAAAYALPLSAPAAAPASVLPENIPCIPSVTAAAFSSELICGTIIAPSPSRFKLLPMLLKSSPENRLPKPSVNAALASLPPSHVLIWSMNPPVTLLISKSRPIAAAASAVAPSVVPPTLVTSF